MRTSTFALPLLLALAQTISAPVQAQSAESGKAVFRQTCGICHDVAPDRNRTGPSLFGVIGRKTGSVPGFHYSDANRNSHLSWDPTTLDRYLEDPRGVIPGTFMSFPGLKDAQKRHDVIEYLETLH
jgi:cytochrome c2